MVKTETSSKAKIEIGRAFGISNCGDWQFSGN
jgi:hypothetical protein